MPVRCFAQASDSNSTALGTNEKASGPASTVLGNATSATGPAATAMGVSARASGQFATGSGTIASTDYSTAMGFLTQAKGAYSTAMGVRTTAAGDGSVALGNGVTAQGNGSFIFGDQSTGFALTAAANTFMVRAFGGLGFNIGVNIGCDLPAGSGAWSCTSSRLAREAFEEVDGEEILTKLAGMPIERWRYIGNAASHIGPFAEDFHAAFGLGDRITPAAGAAPAAVGNRSSP